MSKNYYGNRSSGGYLKHYRTKGSRNGYSKNPNYNVVGQRAKGRWVNGRYVYDQPTNNSMYSKSSSQTKPANVSQEYWDNLQANTNPNYKPEPSKPKKGINTSIDPRYAKRSSQHGTPWVSEEYKQELAYNTGKSYTPKKNAINVNTDPRYKKQETNTGLKGDPRYSVAGTNKIDRAKIEALSKKGAKNNWQQQGNHFRAADEAVNRMAQERSDNAYIGNGSKAANAAMKKYLRDDGVALRRDESYRNALNRHEHKKQMANSERLMKTTSAINYNDPNTAIEYFSGKRADPRFNKSVIKGISRMTYSHTDKYERAKEIADMKARAKTDAEKKAEQKRIKKGEKHHAKVRAEREKTASGIASKFSTAKQKVTDAAVGAAQAAARATDAVVSKGKKTVNSIMSKMKTKDKVNAAPANPNAYQFTYNDKTGQTEYVGKKKKKR